MHRRPVFAHSPELMCSKMHQFSLVDFDCFLVCMIYGSMQRDVSCVQRMDLHNDSLCVVCAANGNIATRALCITYIYVTIRAIRVTYGSLQRCASVNMSAHITSQSYGLPSVPISWGKRKKPANCWRLLVNYSTDVFIPAMIVDNIYCYHYVPLLMPPYVSIRADWA